MLYRACVSLIERLSSKLRLSSASASAHFAHTHSAFSIHFIFALVCTTLTPPILQASSLPVPSGPDDVFIQETADSELKIMSYNVLNLFDAEKDPLSDDWLWLPQNTPGRKEYCEKRRTEKEKNFCLQFDWTDLKINDKLNQIKKVVDFQGSKPDIMAILEIENENVMGRLAQKLGYEHFIITHSADRRGIDVGLLYNLKHGLEFLGQENIYVRFKSKRPGRDILRTDFKWQNQIFSIYVNHWPSQMNPPNERVSAAQALAKNIDEMRLSRGSHWSAVAVGDFNTIPSDVPHPFKDVLHSPDWPEALFDEESQARLSPLNPSWPYSPSGSFYFLRDDSWNTLDRVFATQNLKDGQELDLVHESFRILFPEFMSQKIIKNRQTIRIPFKYNFTTNEEVQRGYSDHLPLIVKIKAIAPN